MLELSFVCHTVTSQELLLFFTLTEMGVSASYLDNKSRHLAGKIRLQNSDYFH